LNDLEIFYDDPQGAGKQCLKSEWIQNLLETPVPCQCHQFLVIYVHTAPGYLSRRQGVRSTWGQLDTVVSGQCADHAAVCHGTPSQRQQPPTTGICWRAGHVRRSCATGLHRHVLHVYNVFNKKLSWCWQQARRVY